MKSITYNIYENDCPTVTDPQVALAQVLTDRILSTRSHRFSLRLATLLKHPSEQVANRCNLRRPSKTSAMGSYAADPS
jgi:hypothetical protein